MALKSQTSKPTESTAEQTESTSALTLVQSSSLFNIAAPRAENSEDLMPQFKVLYPIEVKPGAPFVIADSYHAGLYDGKQFVKLQAPYVISVIAAREGTRKLMVGSEGKEYERGFKAMGEGKASDAIYQQHLTDPAAEKGNVYVIAILRGNDVAICELPAFKTARDYWGNPLFQARVQNRHGLRVDITDHTPNLTVSKKDSQKAYLDPKKFKQHSIVELNDGQVHAVAAALQANRSKFDAWLKR